MLALSEAFWAAVIVALIAAVPATVTLLIRRDVKQINTAVNHVGKNEPTLIQRVTELHEDHVAFREWTCEGLMAIGRQVGVQLPTPPDPTTAKEDK